MQRRSIFPGRSLRIKPAVISESAGFSVQLTTLILGWRDTTPVWPGGITRGLPRGWSRVQTPNRRHASALKRSVADARLLTSPPEEFPWIPPACMCQAYATCEAKKKKNNKDTCNYLFDYVTMYLLLIKKKITSWLNAWQTNNPLRRWGSLRLTTKRSCSFERWHLKFLREEGQLCPLYFKIWILIDSFILYLNGSYDSSSTNR
jgi:hypothetical protein